MLFSDYIDKVFERLDILRQKDALPPAPAAAKATARGSAAEVKALLDMNSVADVSAGVNVQHLFTAARAVCVSQKSPCIRASDIHHMRPVRTLELSVEQVQLLGRRALQLLCLLGLGTTGCSTNTSGTKCLWFVKRPTEHLQNEVLQAALTALRLTAEQYHSVTEEQIRASRRAHQPDIKWADLALPLTKQAIEATAESVAAWELAAPAVPADNA